MNPNTIGGFIAQVRKSNGMTQLELAEKLNISNRTVSKWENGDGYPDITLLEKLADALHITVDELLKGAYCTENTDEKYRGVLSGGGRPYSDRQNQKRHPDPQDLVSCERAGWALVLF